MFLKEDLFMKRERWLSSKSGFIFMFFFLAALINVHLLDMTRKKMKIIICRSWEMNFRKLLRTFYDDVIYIDDSFLWSIEELKIKAKDLRLTLVTFRNLMAVSQANGAHSFRQRGGTKRRNHKVSYFLCKYIENLTVF